jgi:DNA-directed RNA polymerase subunit beta'
VVQLPGGKFATSDLNDFYRRVINRNNRLKQLISLGAPEIILRNEKRMLQEAVDSIIDLQKAHGRSRTTGAASKVKKSLSDILKGKQGRFRQNLLGKRVDYSGRSTIVVGPELKLDQCGIPKEMALELFKPFILREVIIRGYASNIKSAKAFLEAKDPVVFDILEEITKNHPVLLNRAPTLHKLSILAFYPVLTDDYAIKLHPAVCAGYNADFDGDAMGVFLPLSKQSIEEVKNRMLPYYNLLKPADGSPIVVPNKEMALGCYYITSIDHNLVTSEEKMKAFSSEDEALAAYSFGQVKLRQPIYLLHQNKLMKTTIGRIIFNQQIPSELGFFNQEVKAADLKNIIVLAMKTLDGKRVGQLIDDLKQIGFWGATVAGGLSFSIFDIIIADEKNRIIEETENKVREIEDNFKKGLLTEEEKRKLSNNYWMDATEKLADLTWKKMDEENPTKLAIKSGGPRASREQLKQLAAMKGLVVDPLGKIIEIPTKSNYREGLSVFEYVISARGARKGLTDSALKTADAGYLTRRLVDVAHDMIIREEDCMTNQSLTIKVDEERGEKWLDRVRGRFLAADLCTKDKQLILKKGELLDGEKIKSLKDKEIFEITVRSPLHCQSPYGICQKCYGLDLSTNKLVDIGVPVGVIAAQSIGEPGTQLTMRVRHFGGIVISDVTQGLPRVEELLEARTPKVVSPIAGHDGKVSIKEDPQKDMYLITITSTDKGEEQQFAVPRSQKLRVADGQLVVKGTPISEGYLDVDEVLGINGLNAAQIYLLNEIQKVYESQGISIHDKHFEVIIKKMSDKIIIEDEGDSLFVKGEVVSKLRFEEENKKILAQGGRPAIGKVSILGITRAAIYTDSWLSAASFEQTTSVLSQAAISGKVDYLLGLKENVIIGRLIPVTKELIEKYYGKFLKQYAHNQSNIEALS